MIRVGEEQAEPFESRLDQVYEKVERIGEGAYGVVFRGRHRETGEDVALKRIRVDNDGEGYPATAMREVTLLKKLRNDNVVDLREVHRERNNLFLVFEFLSQDLKVYIDAIGPEGMDPTIFKSFSIQMLKGLAECHARGILHRDLKPQNLLINRSGNLKLADFGLARCFRTPNHKYTHEVVTLWYRAPEILLGADHYSTGVDLWAAGCIIAEMSNLSPLFPGNSEIDQLFKIFKVLGTPNESNWPGVGQFLDYSDNFPKWPRRNNMSSLFPHVSEAGASLIMNLVCYPPSSRLTAKEAVEHAFFED